MPTPQTTRAAPPKLRPYQSAAVDQTLQTLRAQVAARQPARVMLCAPRGAGKTAIAVELARRVAEQGNKTLYVVPRLELFAPTLAEIHRWTDDVAALASPTAKLPDPAPHLTLAMAQTMCRRGRHWPQEAAPDLIIVDEAHVAPEQARSLADAFPGAALVGLSATPERLADDALLRLYRTVVVAATDADLVRAGHLAPSRLHTSECPDVSLFRSYDNEFDARDQEEAFCSPRLIGAVVEAASTLASRHRLLIFAASLRHAKELATALGEARIRATCIDDRTPDVERAAAFDQLAKRRLGALCVVDLFTEGVQAPAVDAIFVAHSTLSRSRWLQELAIGRMPAHRKDALLVVDFGDNWRRLGMAHGDREWTLGAQPADTRVRQFWTCGGCGRVATRHLQSCSGCGGKWRTWPADMPPERPALLQKIADHAKHEAAARITSCLQAARRCPARYFRLRRMWNETEAARIAKGLPLPGPGAPLGYTESICERALRRR